MFGSSRLVIETLEPLPKDRKCFRMVNGVLVERTIADVLPALKTNSDGLKQVLEEMLKQYKGKQTELDEWKVSLTLKVAVVLRDYECNIDLDGSTEKEQHPGRAAIDRIIRFSCYDRISPHCIYSSHTLGHYD